ncbi:MAG: DNA-directed RNA polymerase subunit beta' [candidate division TM6 bacterium GW2011_GWF2_36_131]|nr:MAG: DNA-directed RNA polymerase subunit beta' [candidate division TM6 bacterium GW2011_GWF2_36_131]KKQ19518.1 MAG: DNA-directed RNA polymerase subunit beta' [candidate division TM6 bacterium GW2011_GWA2_36_9]
MNSQMLARFKEYVNAAQFNAVRLSLASPEKIRSLSYGEVKKIETINYRTLKPEKDGLFCARIFGPVKDWECNCGKYKRMKHRGVTCEKCGVEVIQARVRRERMGHIELVAPVSHIWYLKGIPSYLSIIMDLAVKDLERVTYFDAYMVINQGNSPYPMKTVLTSTEYEDYCIAHPEDTGFKADMGAAVVREVLSKMDLALELSILKKEYEKSTSVTTRHKLMRRVKILSDLLNAGLTPNLMILEVLPVLPPDLRPLVPLEGGRFASSDLNELYRRVLNRNIRLRRLIDIEAPSVIIKNEKRMLQESVDALIDNGRRGQPVRGSSKRPLKSLSEMLRGKQGRFRQNLLGKRVDYSGRSVIVVDPELKMDQCGLPKIIALELFKPYVLAELVRCENAPNLKAAKRLVEENEDVVWDVLEEVVKERPVLLNRAPTLHRLGIQAFFPVLIEGKAISIHPLVCAAFNADFDGDQMAVHLPLSIKAQAESRELILSSKNLLSPSNGRPITVPSQDMVLGLYYMTKLRRGAQGEGIVFASTNEVVSAFQTGAAALHAQIKVRLESGEIISTTVGRVILYRALPDGADFSWINHVVKKSDVARLIEKIYYAFGREKTVVMLDNIKKLGFTYSTSSGTSFGIEDLIIPQKKEEILDKAEKEVQRVEKLYREGAITDGERHSKVISIWGQATADVAGQMQQELEQQDKTAFENKDNKFTPFNSVFMMLDSGAKGTKEQVKQLVGMRGLMAKPSGEIMETPIKSNFKKGLSVFEYFISTHGARKGQADTALKTANSGYLTRRLVDVAQDVIITMRDCQTLGYIELEDLRESGDIICPVARRAYGRVLAEDLKDPISGELLAKQGTLVDRDLVKVIGDSAVSKIKVRSVLLCQARRGVCAHCYGMDLSRGAFVATGEAVGVIAAQSIGEPGTQLTMKTFHVGGAVSGLIEQTYKAKQDGIVKLSGARIVQRRDDSTIVMSRKSKLSILSPEGRELQEYTLQYGAQIFVADGQQVKKGTKLFEQDSDNKVILTEKAGAVKYIDLIENITLQERFDETANKMQRVILEQKGDRYQPALSIIDDAGTEIAQYYLPAGAYLVVDPNKKVGIGDVLVKIPQQAAKAKDITGGLPRIAELFEARVTKDPAIISDIDGEVVLGGVHRGMIKVSVVSGKNKFDYFIPRGQQLNVINGEHVSAGDPLTSGEPVLHDVLRILGPTALQKYLVNQIQIIYRLHGIDVDDRHVEVIVHQMMRKVRVVNAGDSDFLVGDRVDKIHFKMVNQSLKEEGKRVAVAKSVLMGITMASLDTESFISAASFQETTRILSEAAVAGIVDHLYGLKENVSIGKLIPAGTGIKSFREKYIGEDISELEKMAAEQEKREAEEEISIGA